MVRPKKLIDKGKSFAENVRTAVREKTSVAYIDEIAKCPGEKGYRLVRLEDSLSPFQRKFTVVIDMGDLKISKKRTLRVGDKVEYTLFRDRDLKIRNVRYATVRTVG